MGNAKGVLVQPSCTRGNARKAQHITPSPSTDQLQLVLGKDGLPHDIASDLLRQLYDNIAGAGGLMEILTDKPAQAELLDPIARTCYGGSAPPETSRINPKAL